MVKNLVSHIFMLSVFLSSLMLSGQGAPIDVYWYFPFFILIFFFFINLGLYNKIDKNIFYTVLFIVAFSFVSGCKTPLAVTKQIINICFFLLLSYGYLKFMNFDLKRIMVHYFHIVNIFIIFGFIQVLMFLFGLGSVFKIIFSFLTIPGSITARFQSFDREPSFAAYTLLPALFISFSNLINNTNLFISKFRSFLIIVAYLLTFSLIAYVGIIISALLFFFKNVTPKKLLYGIPFSFMIIILIIGAYAYPPIKLRINDTLKVVTGSSEEDIKQINLSTYAIYSNFVVTKSALENKPLLGTGLGTHDLNYEKYIPSYMKDISGINKKEAASLALRLLSEGGIILFSIFVTFLFRNRLRHSKSENKNATFLWLLNNSIFVMALLHLMRQGHYTVSGFCLFLLIYYYSKKKSTFLFSP